MKFKNGDIFKVVENGLFGQVVGITFNSFYQQEEYIVKWPDLSYDVTYPVDECDPIWELEPCPAVNIYFKPKQSIDFLPIHITIDGPLMAVCAGKHTWVDVGFHFKKEVCKYCNEEKEQT